MFATSFKYLLDHWPMVAFVIFLLVATALIVWKVRALYDKMSSTCKKVDNLPCDSRHETLQSTKDSVTTCVAEIGKKPCFEHKELIEQLVQNNTRVTNSIESMPIVTITESIRKIEEWILRFDMKAMDSLVRKFSPYALTELGKIILLKSKAQSCVDDHLDLFLGKLEETKPMTSYDVEKNALSVVSSETESSIFNGIKDYLYTSPAEVEEIDPETNKPVKVMIDLSRILMMMSIYLRDQYFKVHPEIDLTEFAKEKEGK